MKKSPVKSKTIWGAVIAVLPAVAPLFGLSISDSQAEMISGNVDAIITAIGSLLAIYGRVKASGQISLKG